MKVLCGILVAACCCAAPQESGVGDVAVTTAHPRLLLTPQRLRLLRRERERSSMRWEQFAALISGHAPLPERGFALALDYQVSGDAEAGRQAVEFALGPDADLRQQALVYDWCHDVMGDSERRALAGRLEKAIAAPPADAGVATARARALAAIALFDEVADAPPKELDRLVHRWWEGGIVPAVQGGKDAIARDDAYPLFEFLHAMRDSTILDLREHLPLYFRNFPLEHLISNYPAPYRGADGLYFLGASRGAGQPDVRQAALSRAAELAMVAYDVNASASQVLQGWLMQDRYMLHSAFGAPYEFLWADPYLPGLSYDRAPLMDHDADSGKLFLRSSWDDSATWFGWFDGGPQLYEGGLRQPGTAPLVIGPAAVCFADAAEKCSVKLDGGDTVFVVGLAPRRMYQVEIDNKKTQKLADAGGILELAVTEGKLVTVRVKAR